MVATDVSTLGVLFGGGEMVLMAFPFVFALAVWGVVVEVNTTSVAPAFPLDPCSAGVGIVGVASTTAAAAAASTTWVAAGGATGSCWGSGGATVQGCGYSIGNVLLELVGSEGCWIGMVRHAGAWIGGDDRRDVRLEDSVVGLG